MLFTYIYVYKQAYSEAKFFKIYKYLSIKKECKQNGKVHVNASAWRIFMSVPDLFEKLSNQLN